MHDPKYEDHILIWHGIKINVRVYPSYFEAFEKTYGYPLIHVQLRCDQELPVTTTGYHSKWIPMPDPNWLNNILGHLEDWLNEQAKAKKWTTNSQLDLFGLGAPKP